MRIGIFFGGSSREREVSFAGGRTVYDNLDKSLFRAVPIFVDSLGRFILLEWSYLYKGTIRDFYPSAQYQPKDFQIYIESLAQEPSQVLDTIARSVGQPIQAHEFKQHFDFAFLALHGPLGEDGSLQGLLEWYGIPYSGAGILPSSIGISKAVQARLFADMGFHRPPAIRIKRNDYLQASRQKLETLWQACYQQLGSDFVVKPAHQGSSVGVSLLQSPDFITWQQALDKAFFMRRLQLEAWHALSSQEQYNQIIEWLDLRSGLGLPIVAAYEQQEQLLYQPHQLQQWLSAHKTGQALLYAQQNLETIVLIEAFVEGKEFSCIVVDNTDGTALALPPTQIIKQSKIFDYRAKYLPGISRKVTPIDLPDEQIEAIREACLRLYYAMQGEVYARIDGFITNSGQIYLNDPNTTSGMLPSSFFFHQAAEIGLNPSQFLTYIIESSLKARLANPNLQKESQQLLYQLQARRQQQYQHPPQKIRVGIIMGGYSSERHISVESGRNVYEKLSASERYEPIPLFLTGTPDQWQLYRLPIHLLLKDNADDIKDKILHPKKHPIIDRIRQQAQALTQCYVQNICLEPQAIGFDELASLVDVVFIALHGRPGEDGSLQAILEQHGIAYNGSGIASSSLTINKYETNQYLRQHGVLVAQQRLVYRHEWAASPEQLISSIEQQFGYPLIAKPADDGCSSAVKKIKNRQQLEAYLKASFRPEHEAIIDPSSQVLLSLKPGDPFPARPYVLIEEFVAARGARRFLEITCGLLTTLDQNGNLQYEIFPPSETPALGEVLSLEEKFLAGEGQNITPARFSDDALENQHITQYIQQQLQHVAQLLQIEGYARIDAFVRVYDRMHIELIIIEINSLPGMTPATCIFHQAALHAYTPYDFIDRILQYALQRQRLAKSKQL